MDKFGNVHVPSISCRVPSLADFMELSERVARLESMLRTHVHPNPDHVSGVPGNPHIQSVRSVPPTLPATFPTEE